MALSSKILFVIMLQMLCSVNAGRVLPQTTEDVQSPANREPKELYHYGPVGEEVNPSLTYPPNYYPRTEGCPTNPMSELVGRQLNFILLKIGAIAFVKAILAGLVLLKIPLFFLKMVFLKSFLFPVLIAPLLIHLFNSPTMTEMGPAAGEAPADATGGGGGGGMGRLMSDDDLSSRMWRSLKMFAESEKCVERVACIVGAYNGDSGTGTTLGRAMKLFEMSSPSSVQKRMSSVREAFKRGVRNGSCSEEEFVCHGPELYIQNGAKKMKLI